MEELISEMQALKDSNYKILAWCEQNSIEQPKIMAYSLEKISKLYNNFLDKYGSKQKYASLNSTQNQPIWFENQLILFQWAVVTLSLTRQISLKDFSETQFQFLSLIFRHKESYIIDYEVKCMIIKGKQIRNTWKTEEQDLLADIIKKMPQKNKWNQIARQLYRQSQGKYFRQGKHCRQRWCSYIESRKLQKKWSIQDDIELLQLIGARGKKWNQIVNKFTNSTNKIYLKKRFKFLLQQSRNKISKLTSQKQVVLFLLQRKYSELEKTKNDSDKKLKESLSLKGHAQNILKQDIKNDVFNNSFSLQEFEWNSKEGKKQSSADQRKDKENKLQEQLNLSQGNQQIEKINWVCLNNSAQIFGNTFQMPYYPISIYPQNSSYFLGNVYQGLNYRDRGLQLQQPMSFFFL